MQNNRHNTPNELFRNPFAGMTREKLIQQKALYEKILAEQSPHYIAPVNKKTGKRIEPTKMPWMVPAWERGLKMVNDLLR